MSEKDIGLLAKYGWVVECESPFEIRCEDGSFATLGAAVIVLEYLEYLENWEQVGA